LVYLTNITVLTDVVIS